MTRQYSCSHLLLSLVPGSDILALIPELVVITLVFNHHERLMRGDNPCINHCVTRKAVDFLEDLEDILGQIQRSVYNNLD